MFPIFADPCSPIVLYLILGGLLYYFLSDRIEAGGRAGLRRWFDERDGLIDPMAGVDPVSPPAATTKVPPYDNPNKFGFDLIRQTDPDFDEQDFRDRIAWLFVKVHHAITDQDLSRIRDFTDDRALVGLRARIDAQAQRGYVETFKNLQIEKLFVMTVHQEGPTQTVVLHIAASSARSVVERRSGRLVLPDKYGDGILRRKFTESWVLTRPAGAKSVPRPPIHRCPFCGGPVEENKRYVCTYCGTDLRGPEREWTILGVEFA